MMRFKSNDPPFGMGGLFYKPRYNQRFITGGGGTQSRARYEGLKYDLTDTEHKTDAQIARDAYLASILPKHSVKVNGNKETLDETKILDRDIPEALDDFEKYVDQKLENIDIEHLFDDTHPEHTKAEKMEKLYSGSKELVQRYKATEDPVEHLKTIKSGTGYENYIKTHFNTYRVGKNRLMYGDALTNTKEIPTLIQNNTAQYCAVDAFTDQITGKDGKLKEGSIAEIKNFDTPGYSLFKDAKGEWVYSGRSQEGDKELYSGTDAEGNKTYILPAQGVKIQTSKLTGFESTKGDNVLRFSKDAINNFKAYDLTLKKNNTTDNIISPQKRKYSLIIKCNKGEQYYVDMLDVIKDIYSTTKGNAFEKAGDQLYTIKKGMLPREYYEPHDDPIPIPPERKGFTTDEEFEKAVEEYEMDLVMWENDEKNCIQDKNIYIPFKYMKPVTMVSSMKKVK